MLAKLIDLNINEQKIEIGLKKKKLAHSQPPPTSFIDSNVNLM
jgi:hypothetical protein